MAHKNNGKGQRRVRIRAKRLLQTFASQHPPRPLDKSTDETLSLPLEDAAQNKLMFADTAEAGVRKEPSSPTLTKAGKSAGFQALVYRISVWPLNRRNAFTILSLVLCASFVWAFFYFGRSTPTDVRGKLTQLGDVELTYGNFQAESVSPLCGCFNELKHDSWRGITFAARYLQIQRTSPRPLTVHLITAPEPTNTLWRQPSRFKFRLSQYTIALPSGAEFDPRWLLDKTPSATHEILDKQEYGPEDLFVLISKETMNVALLGDKPLGAWIPSDGSTLEIKYEKPMLLSVPARATLEESFKQYDAANRPVMGVPLGDFLGPNIVLWWKDSSARLSGGGRVLSVNTEKPAGKTIIKALIMSPPFSARVALASVGESYDDDVELESQDAGTVRVSILDPSGQVADFDEIYHRMKANERTTAHDIPIDDEAGGTKNIGMAFRYPAIPPNKGFNIFGSIHSLKLSSALGSILIGSRQFNIDAPSTLELRNISSMNLEGGVMPIPVQLNTNDNRTELQIQAKSEVYLNNETMNKKVHEYRLIEQMPLVSLFASLLSGIAAVWSVKRSKTRNN